MAKKKVVKALGLTPRQFLVLLFKSVDGFSHRQKLLIYSDIISELSTELNQLTK